jgi:hypothetical protein
MAIADYFTDILSQFPNARPLMQGGQKAVFLVEHEKYGV